MGYIRVKIPVLLSETAPENSLLFFDEAINEYYVLIDSYGNYLTWVSV